MHVVDVVTDVLLLMNDKSLESSIIDYILPVAIYPLGLLPSFIERATVAREIKQVGYQFNAVYKFNAHTGTQ